MRISSALSITGALKVVHLNARSRAASSHIFGALCLLITRGRRENFGNLSNSFLHEDLIVPGAQ